MRNVKRYRIIELLEQKYPARRLRNYAIDQLANALNIQRRMLILKIGIDVESPSEISAEQLFIISNFLEVSIEDLFTLEAKEYYKDKSISLKVEVTQVK